MVPINHSLNDVDILQVIRGARSTSFHECKQHLKLDLLPYVL